MCPHSRQNAASGNYRVLLVTDFFIRINFWLQVIRRDIARTYPEHDFFKEKNGLGQESLFNVMKAYSLHDREVGYCQGSGFIVGLLLMQVCSIWSTDFFSELLFFNTTGLRPLIM